MSLAGNWRALALLLTMALVLAACGSEDGDASADVDEDAATDEAPEEGEDAAAAEPGADWPETLVFGAVPSAEEGNLEQSYLPVIRALEEDLGIDVEFVTATDYAGVVESMIAGNIDLAQFGPFSYVIARNNGADISPVGAMIEAPGVEPGYQSYGITQADNDEINELADFEGRNVCFVDPGSTSGFLYPSAGLLDLGIDPETDVTPTFAGGHDSSAVAVATGQCDAGFAFDTMVTNVAIEAGQIEEGDLKVVWESEVIAGSPLAIDNTLPADLIERIQEIILENDGATLFERGFCEEDQTAELDDGTVYCAITDEGIFGYDTVADDFYDGVRAVCDLTEAPACLEG